MSKSKKQQKVNIEIRQLIGNKLRAKRRADDITIKTLAAKLDVDSSTISRYEKGEIDISFTQVIEWCNLLKVKLVSSPRQLKIMRTGEKG